MTKENLNNDDLDQQNKILVYFSSLIKPLIIFNKYFNWGFSI